MAWPAAAPLPKPGRADSTGLRGCDRQQKAPPPGGAGPEFSLPLGHLTMQIKCLRESLLEIIVRLYIDGPMVACLDAKSERPDVNFAPDKAIFHEIGNERAPGLHVHMQADRLTITNSRRKQAGVEATPIRDHCEPIAPTSPGTQSCTNHNLLHDCFAKPNIRDRDAKNFRIDGSSGTENQEETGFCFQPDSLGPPRKVNRQSSRKQRSDS